MSLSYNQMKSLEPEVQSALIGLPFVLIKAIAPRQFILGFGREKMAKSLLLSLQENFLRFHLFFGSSPKIEHPFAERIEKSLMGTVLFHLSLVNEDRILSMEFQRGKRSLFLQAEFFPRKPNLYLFDEQKNIIESLNPLTTGQIYLLPPRPQQKKELDPSSPLNSLEIQEYYANREMQANFVAQKQQIVLKVHKLLKRTQKQLKQRNEQLTVCQTWENVHHEGLLLQANLYQLQKGQTEITLMDWEDPSEEKTIPLNPEEPPADAVARRFRQSKKLKIGLEYAKVQILNLEKEEQKYKKLLEALERVCREEELFRLAPEAEKRQEPPSKESKSSPFREFTTASGLKIWVGKDGLKNEQLTFRFAKGSDFWLHAVGYPGAHVIIRGMKGKELDEDSLLDAVELALRYSKAKDKGASEVCFTQCKYVSRLKRKDSPGKVQISQHKILIGHLDEKRWMKIKNQTPTHLP